MIGLNLTYPEENSLEMSMVITHKDLVLDSIYEIHTDMHTYINSSLLWIQK